MGIPKYFRYISERWPMISQLVGEQPTPEFDNLYLDMNSILHNCTHKDADVTHRLTEEDMYVAIFNYIEHLFFLIRPKKLFYMAIDGVAPRAKMNQQRSRRFRTALDAENARKKALEDGVELPASDPFDSNAITPGTDFMAQLTKQLLYFINRKVSEDSAWQNIQIILSGHEVPGEGEHKIMEHIRFIRSTPGYDANVRHCLYGLDADLIQLGLLSHEPHFSLLREEVTFGRKSANKELVDQPFFLMHLSLVREYLEMEFRDMADLIDFEYDFERVLDDFILVNYFVGNDFLPELPSLHINDDALPLVYKAYKTALTKVDGYLTENGTINFERLAVFLDEMGKFELKKFEDNAIDVQWVNEDLGEVSLENKVDVDSTLTLTPKQHSLFKKAKKYILSVNNEGGSSDVFPIGKLNKAELNFMQNLAQRTSTRVVKNEDSESNEYTLVADSDGFLPDETEEQEDERLSQLHGVLRAYESLPVVDSKLVAKKEKTYNSKFELWKEKYYKEKFGYYSEELVRDVANNYLEGLQWVLYYYYRGVQSWGWYYRYHYAPRISDIAKGLQHEFKFTMGKPFKPFEQLMGVLPDRSRQLVPVPLQSLMIDEHSPIIDFYPRHFELDKNGKKNDWEAVVKIPFVDEKRLLEAMTTQLPKLTPEEKERNSFGANIQFVFNPQLDFVYKSSLPGRFLDIPHTHCKEVPLRPVNDLAALGLTPVFGLLKNTKVGVNALAGFPSLNTLPYTYTIEMAGVKVFQFESRSDSVIIHLENSFKDQSVNEIASKLIGTQVFVNWPYLQEAKVVSICDGSMNYTASAHGHVSGQPVDEKTFQQWGGKIGRIMNGYKHKGVDTGAIDLLIQVKVIKGLVKAQDGSLVKDFGENQQETPIREFPLQTLVESVVNEDERFKERAPLAISDEFPVGLKAIYLGPSAFGTEVTVTHCNDDSVDVKLSKSQQPDPQFGVKVANVESKLLTYFPSFEVSKRLRIHPLLLSKITSGLMVTVGQKKYNVGLDLKFEGKKLKVLGMTRRNEKGWSYSVAAIELLKEYQSRYGKLLSVLEKSMKQSAIPDITHEINADAKVADAMIKEVVNWIRAKQQGFVKISLESEGLSTASIKKIEELVISNSSNPDKSELLVYKHVPRNALLAPEHAYHQLRSQRFKVGDRVVSALDSGKVQLFSKGTVVAINSLENRVTLDVLFDKEFDAGTLLGGRCSTKRGLTIDTGSVLNLSSKQLVCHNGKSAATSKNAPAKKKPASTGAPTTSAWAKKPDLKAKQPSADAQIVKKEKKAADSTAALKGKTKIQNGQNGQNGNTPKTGSKPVSKAPPKSESVKSAKTKSSGTSTPSTSAPAKELSGMDLMAALKASEPSPAEAEKQSKAALSNLKGKGSSRSKKNALGAVYGTYMNPPPPAPFVPGPPVPPGAQFHPGSLPPHPGQMPYPPPPQFPPVPHPSKDDPEAAREILAALNLKK